MRVRSLLGWGILLVALVCFALPIVSVMLLLGNANSSILGASTSIVCWPTALILGIIGILFILGGNEEDRKEKREQKQAELNELQILKLKKELEEKKK